MKQEIQKKLDAATDKYFDNDQVVINDAKANGRYYLYSEGVQMGYSLATEDTKKTIRIQDDLILSLESDVAHETEQRILAREDAMNAGLLLQEANQKIKSLELKLKVTLTALEYYANEMNWYNVNDTSKNSPEIRMVIGSMDTEGRNWIGGRNARLALESIGVIDKVTK